MLGLTIPQDGSGSHAILKLKRIITHLTKLISCIKYKRTGRKKPDLIRLIQAIFMSRVTYGTPYLSISQPSGKSVVILSKAHKRQPSDLLHAHRTQKYFNSAPGKSSVRRNALRDFNSSNSEMLDVRPWCALDIHRLRPPYAEYGFHYLSGNRFALPQFLEICTQPIALEHIGFAPNIFRHHLKIERMCCTQMPLPT